MIPKKLNLGDEVRVIAPSRSMGILSQETKEVAKKRFEDMGLKLTFGNHVEEIDEFMSSSIESRIEDLHDAFMDKNVKAVITTIGGHNSHQLLRYIDFELIKNNPKIICGFSDITILSNSIYAKTGITTYYGPHFSTFGMEKGIEYTIEYFKKCLMNNESIKVESSSKWSDDAWYLDQENREFIENKGYKIINEGKASGKIVGGNLCTLNLLQGTEYMPSLKDSILFIEDDCLTFPENFDRDLQSLIHLPDFQYVKGIVIGRFQKESKITDEMLEKIIKTKKELNNIPVISNADFGHTTPAFTFPIGGMGEVIACGGSVELEIVEH